MRLAACLFVLVAACDTNDGAADLSADLSAHDVGAHNGCSQLLQCRNLCTAGDSSCAEGCYAGTSAAGQNLYLALRQCQANLCNNADASPPGCTAADLTSLTDPENVDALSTGCYDCILDAAGGMCSAAETACTAN
jgi:hypothetical protein